jgi:Chaperone of endosialidase
LTILKDGNVGIGTVVPGAALSVVNPGATEPTVSGVPATLKVGSPFGTIPIALRQDADESSTPTLASFETSSGGLGYLGAGSNKFALGAAPGKQLGLRANGSTESIVIDTNGTVGIPANVGIGTLSPATRLDIRGNLTLDPGGNPILYTSATSGEQNRYLSLINSPTTQTASGLKAGGILVADSYAYANPGKNELVVRGKIRVGDLGINGDTPLCRNNSTNEIALCNTSSLRYKTNIRPYTLGLDLIARLNPISFNWKQTGRADLGLAAEEVAKVAPSFTFTNSKGEIEGVRYDRLNVPLINAIKQQQEQIETLRAQNAALNARLRSIERIVRKRVGVSRHCH